MIALELGIYQTASTHSGFIVGLSGDGVVVVFLPQIYILPALTVAPHAVAEAEVAHGIVEELAAETLAVAAIEQHGIHAEQSVGCHAPHYRVGGTCIFHHQDGITTIVTLLYAGEPHFHAHGLRAVSEGHGPAANADTFKHTALFAELGTHAIGLKNKGTSGIADGGIGH